MSFFPAPAWAGRLRLCVICLQQWPGKDFEGLVVEIGRWNLVFLWLGSLHDAFFCICKLRSISHSCSLVTGIETILSQAFLLLFKCRCYHRLPDVMWKFPEWTLDCCYSILVVTFVFSVKRSEWLGTKIDDKGTRGQVKVTITMANLSNIYVAILFVRKRNQFQVPHTYRTSDWI